MTIENALWHLGRPSSGRARANRHNGHMANGLFALYKLHEVDAELHGLKQRAAALDVGSAEAHEIKRLESDPDGDLGEAKRLKTRLRELETEQDVLRERLKKLDKELYGGSVVNPREVEGIEAEMKHIRENLDANDSLVLELLDTMPEVEARANKIGERITELKREIVRKQFAAKETHGALQTQYKQTAARRPALAKDVPPALLGTYEKLREKMGVGLAMVDDNHRCGECHMPVSEKALEHVTQDRVAQCENCHRILFKFQQ